MRARRFALPFFIVVPVIIACALLATHIADAYEHVQNGGFEDGTTGWIAAYGASISTAAAPEASAPEGEQVGRVTLADSRFEIRPSMSGTVGAGAYELSMQASTALSETSVRVRAQGAGFEESRIVMLSAGAWTPITMPLTAPVAGPVAITISGSGQRGDVFYVDDVRLTGAPPVTLTPTASPVVMDPSTPTAVAIATTAISATPTPVVDVIAPHLRNPSFEETDAEGAPFAWGKFGGALTGAESPVRSGERAARLDSTTSSTKWLYQPVVVDGGATYAFDVWVWHDDPGVAGALLRVSWYASGDGSGAAIASADSPTLDQPESGYRSLTTGPITAPPDARSARLRVLLQPMSNAPSRIFVDDAWFGPAAPLPRATVTPSAAAMAGVDSTGTSRVSRVAGAGASRPSARRTDSAAHAAGPSNARLVINEVLYDFAGDGDDAGGEWVEIFNAGSNDVSIEGWALRDNVRSVALPDITVPAGGFAIVAASDRFLAAYPEFQGIVAWLDGRIGNGLGNDGDQLELLAPDGAVADAISWGENSAKLDPAIQDVPAGHSIERRVVGADTDESGDFVDNASPSPGHAIEGTDGKPKPQTIGSAVEILEPASSSLPDWLPWALVGLSGAALAGSVGWRTVSAVRDRSRPV